MLQQKSKYKLSRKFSPSRYFTQLRSSVQAPVPKLLKNNRSFKETQSIYLSSNKHGVSGKSPMKKMPGLVNIQTPSNRFTAHSKSRSMTNLKDLPNLLENRKSVLLIEKGEIHEAMKQPRTKSPNRLKTVWRKTRVLPGIYDDISISLSQKKIENALQRSIEYLRLNQSYT
jgi:hypothetical protein